MDRVHSKERFVGPRKDGIGLDIRHEDIFGILGPNDCCKSTLLRNPNKNQEPHQGRVMLEEDFKDISWNKVAKALSSLIPKVRFTHVLWENEFASRVYTFLNAEMDRN